MTPDLGNFSRGAQGACSPPVAPPHSHAHLPSRLIHHAHTPPIAHRPRWAPNRGKAGLIRRRTAEPLPQRRRARLCAADLICSHRPASLAPSRSHLMTHHISPLLVLLFVCTLPILRAQSVTVTIDDSTGGEYHVHPIGAVFTIKVLTRGSGRFCEVVCAACVRVSQRDVFVCRAALCRLRTAWFIDLGF